MTDVLARAYLPIPSSRYTQIFNAESRANADQPGSAVYIPAAAALPDHPKDCGSPAWDLTTPAAVARFRRAGARIVPKERV